MLPQIIPLESLGAAAQRFEESSALRTPNRRDHPLFYDVYHLVAFFLEPFSFFREVALKHATVLRVGPALQIQ